MSSDIEETKREIFHDYNKAWNPNSKISNSLVQTARTYKNFSRIEDLIENFLQEKPFNHSLALDIGCGAGKSTAKIKKMLPLAKVYGIDVSRYALKEAKKHSNANFICASMEKLPLRKDLKFDMIVAGQSLDIFPNEEYLKRIISEITNYSSKDARFYMAFYGDDVQHLELDICTPIGLTLDKFGWKVIHGGLYNLSEELSEGYHYARGVFWVNEKT